MDRRKYHHIIGEAIWGEMILRFSLMLMHWDWQCFSFLLQIILATHSRVVKPQKATRGRGEAQQRSREVQGREPLMNELTSYIR